MAHQPSSQCDTWPERSKLGIITFLKQMEPISIEQAVLQCQRALSPVELVEREPALLQCSLREIAIECTFSGIPEHPGLTTSSPATRVEVKQKRKPNVDLLAR